MAERGALTRGARGPVARQHRISLRDAWIPIIRSRPRPTVLGERALHSGSCVEIAVVSSLRRPSLMGTAIVACRLFAQCPPGALMLAARTRPKGGKPAVLQQLRTLFVGQERRHDEVLEGVRAGWLGADEHTAQRCRHRFCRTAARPPACKALADLDGQSAVARWASQQASPRTGSQASAARSAARRGGVSDRRPRGRDARTRVAGWLDASARERGAAAPQTHNCRGSANTLSREHDQPMTRQMASTLSSLHGLTPPNGT
jgi:hypothetical protein